MIHKLTRPYLLFLFTGIILYIIYTVNADRTLDVNVHDTYFVISFGSIGFVALIMYVIYSGIYFLMRQYHHYILSLIHLLSGIPLFVILFLQGSSFLTNGQPKRYYTNSEVSFLDEDTLLTWYMVIFILFFAGQMIFFGNIILAAVKAIRTKME